MKINVCVWMLLGVLVWSSSAADPPCGHIGPVIIRALSCLSDIFPNPDHPMYAPIIGGADIDFAKDMCASKRWTKGLECLFHIGEECTTSPRLRDFLRSLFNEKRFEEGMGRFCASLDTYKRYAECYFDNRESLTDCAFKSWRPALDWYIKNRKASIPVLVKNTCRFFGNFENCQINEVRRYCGNKPADYLRDMTFQFRPPTCGACSKSTSLLIVSLTAIITKLFV